MTETASEARPLATLALEPLPVESLSPAVLELLRGPAPSKAMAARGISALRPSDLLVALYQLTFEPDPAVKSAAEQAPQNLPDKVVVSPLGEPLPAVVLHFFAERLAPTRAEALEKILYNQGTADETFVLLASRLGERELEIILQNEARLLRCPAIVEASYLNVQVRMSSLNRAIELCARNGARLNSIPSFDEVVRSISDDPSSREPGPGDVLVAETLALTAEAAEAPEGDSATAPDGDEAHQPGARKGPVIDFSRLKLHEKVRLATLGNAYCRKVLLRDPNRLVAMAAIRSPNITENEIIGAAGNRNVSEDVIRYIANQRDLLKHYSVRLNLSTNPKCPLAFSLRFLTSLRAEDVKNIARSKNVPSALAVAARKLVQTRGG